MRKMSVFLWRAWRYCLWMVAVSTVVLSVCAARAEDKQPVVEKRLPSFDSQLQDRLIAYLKANAMTPEEYICDKFKSHDLVIVGEWHCVKQNVDLLHRLLPMIYKSCGVRFLGYEWYAASLQNEIDALVTAKEYDEALAMKILRESAARTGALWPYQEYIDTFKLVWKLNQIVDQPSEKLRIIFMAPDINWSPMHHGNKSEKLKLFLQLAVVDKYYADQIIQQYDGNGRKGLIWCGSTHAATHLKSPRPQSRPKRMGAYLNDRYGDKVFMVRLHEPMLTLKGFNFLLDGKLDRALHQFGKPVGFDIVGSPLADIKIPKECFWAMDNPNATLSAYNDGYIWLTPLEKFQGVHLLDLNNIVPDEKIFEPIGQNCKEPTTREEYLREWSNQAKQLRDFPKEIIFNRFPK